MEPRIDWQRLLKEFEGFEADADFRQFAPEAFVQALLRPVPEFVAFFLARKTRRAKGREEAVRDLYAYLLEKRYNERLNLLHFAFEIFDAPTTLPDDVVNRTPLPHEEGLPNYRHRLNPAYRLKPDTSKAQ